MYNETSEWGDNATFVLALASQPTSDVLVTVMPVILSPHPHGGPSRYEGAPIGFGSTYEVIKYKIDDQDHVLGSTDSLESGGEMKLVFTPDDWALPRYVMIQGMDDWINDYNTTYYVGVVFSSLDPNYETPYDAAEVATNGAYSPPASGYGSGYSHATGVAPAISLPFTNVDNDTIGLTVVGSAAPGICSEPYYGYTGYITVYVNSQPKETMLLTVTSSIPAEAKPATTLVAITPDDWTNTQIIAIESIDDPVADGDIHFNVTVATLFTADADYGVLGPNREGSYGLIWQTVPFISVDDPDDTAESSCAPGYYGLYADVSVDSSYYNDWFGCHLCPAGTYSDESADKLWCRACPPGTFGLVEGATSMQSATDWEGGALDPGCVPCPNGTYNSGWGATACDPCPYNYSCPLASSNPLPHWLEVEAVGVSSPSSSQSTMEALGLSEDSRPGRTSQNLPRDSEGESERPWEDADSSGGGGAEVEEEEVPPPPPSSSSS